MKHFTRLLIISLMMLTIIDANSQNGTRLIGYDAKTIGRGGTVTGFFDNPSLMMNNPGGIAFLPSSQLDINFSLMVPKVTFENQYNNTEGKQNYFPLPSIWYVKKIPNSKFNFGFGVFTQGGMGADFKLNHPLYKDSKYDFVKQPYHSKFAVMQGGPSLSYKFSEKLALGISTHLVYSQMEFQMPYSLSPSVLKGVINPQNGMTFGNLFSASYENGGLNYTEVTASANMKDLTSFSFAGKIGLAWKPNSKVSVGMNYNTATALHFKNGVAEMNMLTQMNDAFGKVVAGIMQQNPNMTPEEAQTAAMQNFMQMGIDLTKGAEATYDLQSKFKLPQSLAIGISYAINKNIRVGLDAEWINWANAFDKMKLTLSNGANPNINRMMGNDGDFKIDFPLNWKNSVVIRTGGEFDVSKNITGRLGYIYGSNPVPASTLFPVFPAIIEHHLTTGMSVKLSNPLTLNLAYEHGFKNELKAADPSLIAEEFSGSTSGLKTSIYHISVSWKL